MDISLPKTIAAGMNLSLSFPCQDYPVDMGWVVSFTLVKAGKQISISATQDGENHVVNLSHVDTGNFEQGSYHYQAYATHTDNGRELIGSGVVEILPDFSAQTDGFDARSWLDKAIDALEAAIEGRASKTQLSQSFKNVQVQHMTLEEQISARDNLLRKRVIRDGKAHKTIGVRFGR